MYIPCSRFTLAAIAIELLSIVDKFNVYTIYVRSKCKVFALTTHVTCPMAWVLDILGL